jgi:hypothetical protein
MGNLKIVDGLLVGCRQYSSELLTMGDLCDIVEEVTETENWIDFPDFACTLNDCHSLTNNRVM